MPKAEGAISLLVKEFMTNNIKVLKNNSEIQTSKYNHLLVKEKRPWSLTYDYGYLDNFLDSTSSTFNSQNLITKSHSVGIGREFIWGGALSFDNTFTKIDRSRYSTAILGTDNPVVYEFNQSIGYSQSLGKNLFGREEFAELRASENLYEFNKARLDFDSEVELRKFYKNYILVQLNKSLDKLYAQAYIRAIKRKEYIKKRVKDGIREKVDLYQAKYNEISQREILYTNKKRTQNSLEGISNLLHREVSLKEVLPISLYKVDRNLFKRSGWKNNKSLKTLDKKADYLKENLKKNEYGVFPEITLSGQYKSNKYDEDSGTARSNGSLGNAADELIVGLNLTWTIGQKLQELEASKSRVDLYVAGIERQKIEKNLNNTESSLRKKKSIVEKNINSATQRKHFATKVLKEYYRLYKLGRADLDQVIRAEEDLIATEISYVNYLANREDLIAELASLYGVLEKYLINKKN